MKKWISLLVSAVLFVSYSAHSQKATSPKPFYSASAADRAPKAAARPKLVVGMVVDQMRWDYLYRYADRYTSNGFKRLLHEGFSCENTLINYTPTITACGHTCVYTGSVPAIHGIVGNGWYSREIGRNMYCAEDTSVNTVGSYSKAGKMSPRNMLVTTIGDELRLSNNFQSKVVGVAIKDRGAILPAGHSATAAFWFDASAGNWITSTYYMNELPAWAKEFNDQKWPLQYLKTPWTTLYPVETYKLSTADDKPYEGRFPNVANSAFPHDLSQQPGRIASTPWGNTMTLEFAKKALEAYNLGGGSVTDMLAISLSSTDYVGHQFGPNSIEAEDTYLRLDKDLGAFFDYLDKRIGKGQWTFFITADHGVAHVPGFMEENKLPNGTWDDKVTLSGLNEQINAKFGVSKALQAFSNYQFYLDHAAIANAGKTAREITDFVIDQLLQQKAIANAFPIKELNQTTLPEPMRSMMANGYNVKRGGDIQVVLQPGWIEGGKTGTTHGLWYPYDAHIPLVWLGWGIKPGKSNRTIGMTDISPTLAALLHIQMPSGNVGKVIEEITK
ncbi:alkaline phosphatase PafA [uncultured Chitinophaga sp.]|uniref:alkaline phosphatase PafA n=1 Tax=uncultured Chitinophaga sp. TaxID=339340 RepID=UPI002629F431|nr:alkaline phosphatase PafA [uncultured Chitinophaga sp.]